MQEQHIPLNGTSLFTFTNEHFNSFCLSFYVKAGCIYELEKESGITHLLEHVLFRNIKKKYDDRLYDLLSLNGLSFSGRTYKEFLQFCIDGPVFGFDFACEVICSLFDPLTVNGEIFRKEKDRIKAEIREGDQRYCSRTLFSKRIWENTNCDKPILGYCHTLDRISAKQLELFRQKIFSAGNCFFYATGNVSQENIQRLATRISRLPIAQTAICHDNTVALSPQFFHRSGIPFIRSNGEQNAFFAFDVDTTRYDCGVMDMIYNILFTDNNALLYQHLSEDRPLIYSYDSCYERYRNAGSLQFEFLWTPDKLQENVESVIGAIKALKDGNFDFQSHLNYEAANWICQQDHPAELNWSLAYNGHILNTPPVCYTSPLLGRFDSISKEDVMQAAQNIFRKENMTVLVECGKTKGNDTILSRLAEI